MRAFPGFHFRASAGELHKRIHNVWLICQLLECFTHDILSIVQKMIGESDMKVYKEYDLIIKFEIDATTQDLFFKKREKIIYTKDYSFITSSLENAKTKQEEIEAHSLDFLIEEIESALSVKKRYQLFRTNEFSKNLVVLHSVNQISSVLKEKVDFSKCSAEYAFQNLSIEQFQEMWSCFDKTIV